MATPSYSNLLSSFSPSDTVKYFHGVSRFGRVSNVHTSPAKDFPVSDYKNGIAINMGILVALGVVFLFITGFLFFHSCVKKKNPRE